ncbi:hypothetical protein B7494_g2855 [Chlorociboria aeruginascens]|nr:hypothetical protein B7494_g2855 [Chlorociboria aeruginascens]
MATMAFKLLVDDPKSRLIIFCTVGQSWRTDSYRMMSGASDKIFILVFDYRGFGRSTGSPNESGLLTDAISVIEWALEIGISPDRIILLAQSLGTAVAAAAAEHFITLQPKIEFSGVILCAGFTNAANAFSNYAIGGMVPLLSPLRLRLFRDWFSRQMSDTWKTSDRVAILVKSSTRLRLFLIHASNDRTLPWKMCNDLFGIAMASTGDEVHAPLSYDLGEGGRVTTWLSNVSTNLVLCNARVTTNLESNGLVMAAEELALTGRSYEKYSNGQEY